MDTFNANVFGGFIGDKPKLIHLETHTFKVNIKNPDGSAFDLSGFVTAECAVNNSFDHNYNELMAYAGSTAAVITDAAGGEIEITLDCNTLKFGEVVTYDSNICWFEVNCFDSEAKMTRVLLDRVDCLPHVRDNEGAPVSGDPGYYNKTETNALIAGAGAVKSVNGKTGAVELNAEDVGAIAEPETAGTTGQVLTQTDDGPAWKSPEQIVPVNATSFSPQSGIYYTQTAASGDIDYTFAFVPAQPCTFEFWITKIASGAWSFSTSTGVSCWWEADGVFAAANPPPDMTSTAQVYALTFRWDGAQLLGNLAYSKAVTA